MKLHPTVVIAIAAQAAHEANRQHCKAIGDDSQLPWEEAPDWQKNSAMMGVAGVSKGNGPEQSHESWMQHKLEEGWVYGEVKDPEAKTHPCLVPYAELPPEQRIKDALFVGVARAVLQVYGLTPAEG